MNFSVKKSTDKFQLYKSSNEQSNEIELEKREKERRMLMSIVHNSSYCFMISFSSVKMCCNRWRDYKYWQYECEKWHWTNQKQYKIYRMQFWLYFWKWLHDPAERMWSKNAKQRIENGFIDAVNSWIDWNNMVHSIASQIDSAISRLTKNCMAIS